MTAVLVFLCMVATVLVLDGATVLLHRLDEHSISRAATSSRTVQVAARPPYPVGAVGSHWPAASTGRQPVQGRAS